jgi:hypothetical protein
MQVQECVPICFTVWNDNYIFWYFASIKTITLELRTQHNPCQFPFSTLIAGAIQKTKYKFHGATILHSIDRILILTSDEIS